MRKITSLTIEQIREQNRLRQKKFQDKKRANKKEQDELMVFIGLIPIEAGKVNRPPRKSFGTRDYEEDMVAVEGYYC